MKKKVFLIAVAVLLVSVMALGVTLAYMTDKKQAANTFTVGNVKITLDEAAVEQVVAEDGSVNYVANDNAARVTENSYDALLPGSAIAKDPTVTNVGASPAYIRVTIKHNNQNAIFDNISTEQFLAMIQGLVTDGVAHMDVAWNLADEDNTIGANADNWATYTAADLANDEKIYVLYFTDPLAAGEAITIFTGIDIPGSFKEAELAALQDLKITITADAIQAAGFADVQAAFAAFDAQNP